MQEINNNDLVITVISICIIFFVLTSFIIIFVVIQNKRKARHAIEISNLKFAYEQTLLQSQLEIKEQTLQQVALELHDNLGQVASLIKIHLNTLQLHDQSKSESKIEATKELVRELITDLKYLSINLNSDRITQLGIVRGLERDIERLNRSEKFHAKFSNEQDVPYIDPNTTIILYRMSQEILNNMVKHSEASCISVSIGKTDNFLKLVFADDGVGFNLEEKMGGGSGLTNLSKRAALINGRITIQSAAQQGTSVTIEIPV